jgi:hypothetical protein
MATSALDRRPCVDAILGLRIRSRPRRAQPGQDPVNGALRYSAAARPAQQHLRGRLWPGRSHTERTINSLGDLTVSCIRQRRMQGKTESNPNNEEPRSFYEQNNEVGVHAPLAAQRLLTRWFQLPSAAWPRLRVGAGGARVGGNGGRRSAIPIRRGVGSDESRTFATLLSRGNGGAGFRGGNFVVRPHRGHRAGARRARAPTDNSGASAGSPDGSPGPAGSPASTPAPAGSPGGVTGSGSQCRARSGSDCTAAPGSRSSASARSDGNAVSGSRRSAGCAEFGGRSAGNQKPARCATRRHCAAQPAGAERAERPCTRHPIRAGEHRPAHPARPQCVTASAHWPAAEPAGAEPARAEPARAGWCPTIFWSSNPAATRVGAAERGGPQCCPAGGAAR